MTAKEYLRSYKGSMYNFQEVCQIVGDLYKVRHDEEATEDYYDRILSSDIRYGKWEEEHQEWKGLHQKYGALDREPEYIRYKGEIDRYAASNIREELLKVVRADKSFEYITCLLLGQPSCEIDALEIERNIREELSRELEASSKRVVELENLLNTFSKEIDASNQSNTKEIERKDRTMKVTTDVLEDILRQLDVDRNKTDGTKIAKFISYITGFSVNTIRQRFSNKEELTNSHREEIEKVNKLLKDINLEITITYNKQR